MDTRKPPVRPIDDILGRWIALNHFHHYLLPSKARTACGVLIHPTWFRSPTFGQMSLSHCAACIAACRADLAPYVLTPVKP